MFNVSLETDHSVSLGRLCTRTLAGLMREDGRVVHLDADMRGTIGTQALADEFPDRVIQVGIAEANMMGIACGLSVAGKIAFANSFGIFSTRRCADQIYMSGCYNNANVKILGTDPGVSATHNGGTHMPLEDTALMRSFPGMKVFDVADPVLLEQVLVQMKEDYGMSYLRFPRTVYETYYTPENRFQLAKGNLLRTGRDVTIVASGMEVPHALRAAEALALQGIEADVIDMFTIKPLDTELLIRRARATGAVVTAENHSIIGGLGSAVAEMLSEQCPVPMRRIGVRDRFGEVGTAQYLTEIFHLTGEDIAAACLEVLKPMHV